MTDNSDCEEIYVIMNDRRYTDVAKAIDDAKAQKLEKAIIYVYYSFDDVLSCVLGITADDGYEPFIIGIYCL